MRTNSNLAVKLPRQEEQVRQPEIVKVPKAKPAAKPMSPVKVLLFLMVIIGLSFSVMYSRAQLNELGAKVNSAAKELETLKSENIRLQTELEDRISLKNVEEYATVELGMEKMDASQVEYVTLSGGNQVEITENNDSSVWQKIKNFFDDMMEYIGI
ncbi:MAG: cell division protein FtsL [Clostridiales bacterium]|nr:cell division protein FtsL [Clostridiales bacterium]